MRLELNEIIKNLYKNAPVLAFVCKTSELIELRFLMRFLLRRLAIFVIGKRTKRLPFSGSSIVMLKSDAGRGPSASICA